MQLTPYAGVVPFSSDWIVTLATIYCESSLRFPYSISWKGWGVGVVGGWIQRLGDDTGGLDKLTNGARGNSVGLGPDITWTAKVGRTPLSAELRRINEFEAHNRPKGNAVLLSFSATFEEARAP